MFELDLDVSIPTLFIRAKNEKTTKKFQLRCGRKTPENHSHEKPTQSIVTENPTHISAPSEIQTRVPEVEGEARHRYTNTLETVAIGQMN